MNIFVCARCGSRVIPEGILDNGGVAWWYRCRNSLCKRVYGRPVYENDLNWERIDLLDPGLEPWPDNAQAFRVTVKLQERRIAMKDLRRYIGEGTLAAVIALSII